MTDFVLTELVNAPLARVETAALGVDADNKFVTADVGKAVKLAAANNFVPCADGDEIEGFVTSVEPYTVNDGFSVGGVQRDRRKEVVVGPSQVGAIAVGALVVSDVPDALGTAGAGAAKVKTGTPTTFIWRVISIASGTGVSGDKVIIERV